MNIIWTAKNHLSTYCTKTYGLTSQLYKYTYATKALEIQVENIEKKCLEMREVLNIPIPQTADLEKVTLHVRLNNTLKLLLPEALRDDISMINNEDAYQQVLSILANNSNKMESPFHLILISNDESYGIVNYVKHCPGYFFNDLIKKIVQSNLFVKDKIEAIDKILICYHKYIKVAVDTYCYSINHHEKFNHLEENFRHKLQLIGRDSNNENPIITLLSVILESGVRSYKIGLSYLPQLSKECSWGECLNHSDRIFFFDYCIEYINMLFKLVSVIPDDRLKNRLKVSIINYFVFIRFNYDLMRIICVVNFLLFIHGSSTWLSPLLNQYLSSMLYEVHATPPLIILIMKAFSKYGNILYPLLYIASVIGNCYVLGNWIYS